MDDLNGRVALVTGSSRGIGRAIAMALARAGADIALNYLNRSADAQAVESEIRELHRRCATIQADVSRAEDVERLIATCETQLGAIDILVNNAGIARRQAIEQITERDWDELMAANLKSCFLVTQAALPGMRQRKWGRIVNLSIGGGPSGRSGGPALCRVEGRHDRPHPFLRSSSGERRHTVNAIAPALIETEMVTANLSARPDLIPIGRFGAVDEVADVAVLLARNGYITGQTVNVNGGWFMS